MNTLKDSPVEHVAKDLGEIWTRLLDHRAVLQGEIKYFVKEFETKRNDRESKKLEADRERLSELGEKTVPETANMMKEHIPNLIDQLEAANKICAHLHQQEEKCMEMKPLVEARKKREEKWASFLEELSRERDKEDVEHAKEMSAIDDHFAKLVDTLQPSSSP